MLIRKVIQMRRNALYAFGMLTFIWLILVESFSWFAIGTGAVVSAVCLLFAWKFLPLKQIDDVKFSRLLLYPFYLVKEIYVQGFRLIKTILFGDVRVDMVDVETELKSDFLRAILMASIIMTPGSITLGLEEKTLTALNLSNAKDTPEHAYQAVDKQRADMERRLIRAQK